MREPTHGVALDRGGTVICLCGEVCNARMGKSPARILGAGSDYYVAESAASVFARHLRASRISDGTDE